MKMSESEAQKRWMKENSMIFSVRIMRRTEADIVDFLEKKADQGISKGTVIKLALREYIKNHKEEQK